eukprot:TRINITY_DN13729_c0_g1_i8.p1 TRINITY_DN13729_c0_g1~~TRINITY_DN13729_c0_g1_i8.p1  ORF type:complete len:1767 (-),score=444.58 TRINITY_DN13729_c0_g1_i8:39-4949(-)
MAIPPLSDRPSGVEWFWEGRILPLANLEFRKVFFSPHKSAAESMSSVPSDAFKRVRILIFVGTDHFKVEQDKTKFLPPGDKNKLLAELVSSKGIGRSSPMELKLKAEEWLRNSYLRFDKEAEIVEETTGGELVLKVNTISIAKGHLLRIESRQSNNKTSQAAMKKLFPFLVGPKNKIVIGRVTDIKPIGAGPNRKYHVRMLRITWRQTAEAIEFDLDSTLLAHLTFKNPTSIGNYQSKFKLSRPKGMWITNLKEIEASIHVGGFPALPKIQQQHDVDAPGTEGIIKEVLEPMYLNIFRFEGDVLQAVPMADKAGTDPIRHASVSSSAQGSVVSWELGKKVAITKPGRYVMRISYEPQCGVPPRDIPFEVTPADPCRFEANWKAHIQPVITAECLLPPISISFYDKHGNLTSPPPLDVIQSSIKITNPACASHVTDLILKEGDRRVMVQPFRLPQVKLDLGKRNNPLYPTRVSIDKFSHVDISTHILPSEPHHVEMIEPERHKVFNLETIPRVVLYVFDVHGNRVTRPGAFQCPHDNGKPLEGSLPYLHGKVEVSLEVVDAIERRVEPLQADGTVLFQNLHVQATEYLQGERKDAVAALKIRLSEYPGAGWREPPFLKISAGRTPVSLRVCDKRNDELAGPVRTPEGKNQRLIVTVLNETASQLGTYDDVLVLATDLPSSDPMDTTSTPSKGKGRGRGRTTQNSSNSNNNNNINNFEFPIERGRADVNLPTKQSVGVYDYVLYVKNHPQVHARVCLKIQTGVPKKLLALDAKGEALYGPISVVCGSPLGAYIVAKGDFSVCRLDWFTEDRLRADIPPEVAHGAISFDRVKEEHAEDEKIALHISDISTSLASFNITIADNESLLEEAIIQVAVNHTPSTLSIKRISRSLDDAVEQERGDASAFTLRNGELMECRVRILDGKDHLVMTEAEVAVEVTCDLPDMAWALLDPFTLAPIKPVRVHQGVGNLKCIVALRRQPGRQTYITDPRPCKLVCKMNRPVSLARVVDMVMTPGEDIVAFRMGNLPRDWKLVAGSPLPDLAITLVTENGQERSIPSGDEVSLRFSGQTRYNAVLPGPTFSLPLEALPIVNCVYAKGASITAPTEACLYDLKVLLNGDELVYAGTGDPPSVSVVGAQASGLVLDVHVAGRKSNDVHATSSNRVLGDVLVRAVDSYGNVLFSNAPEHPYSVDITKRSSDGELQSCGLRFTAERVDSGWGGLMFKGASILGEDSTSSYVLLVGWANLEGRLSFNYADTERNAKQLELSERRSAVRIKVSNHLLAVGNKTTALTQDATKMKRRITELSTELKRLEGAPGSSGSSGSSSSRSLQVVTSYRKLYTELRSTARPESMTMGTNYSNFLNRLKRIQQSKPGVSVNMVVECVTIDHPFLIIPASKLLSSMLSKVLAGSPGDMKAVEHDLTHAAQSANVEIDFAHAGMFASRAPRHLRDISRVPGVVDYLINLLQFPQHMKGLIETVVQDTLVFLTESDMNTYYDNMQQTQNLIALDTGKLVRGGWKKLGERDQRPAICIGSGPPDRSAVYKKATRALAEMDNIAADCDKLQEDIRMIEDKIRISDEWRRDTETLVHEPFDTRRPLDQLEASVVAMEQKLMDPRLGAILGPYASASASSSRDIRSHTSQR